MTRLRKWGGKDNGAEFVQSFSLERQIVQWLMIRDKGLDQDGEICASLTAAPLAFGETRPFPSFFLREAAENYELDGRTEVTIS